MVWQPRIENITERILIGKRMNQSLADDKTAVLWSSFMPERKKIKSIKNDNLYSVQVYPVNYFNEFNPNAIFEKWSAVEVNMVEGLSSNFEVLVIPPGLYAVFSYQGISTDPSIFKFIYTEWVPSSGYVVDNRPHFEVLGEKYRNNDPQSEEDIFIPLREQ